MGNFNSRCEACKYCTVNHYKGNKECTCFCQARVKCTCKCNVGSGHDIAQKISAIVAGIGVGAGGIAVTVLTGGIALPIIGGMVTGAGFSSVFHGSLKSAKREKICAKDFGVDVGIGFVTGAIGGGGTVATERLAGLAVRNVAKETVERGAIKFGVRVAGQIASSVVQLAMAKGANVVKRKKKYRKYIPDHGPVAKAPGTQVEEEQIPMTSLQPKNRF